MYEMIMSGGYIFGWLTLLIVLLIIEIITVGLTTIWFVVGCVAALIAYAFGAGLVIQIVLFLAVSIALLVFTRPWAVRCLNSSRMKTNYEGMIGKVIQLQEDVDNIAESGKATVNGVEWTVRSEDGKVTLPKGSLAQVVRVSGVKLIVREYKEE